MRRLPTAVLSAAIAALAFALPAARPSHAAPADAAPATQPAGQQAEVPVKQVVLFSSGVGYFEHYGTVNGTGDTELRFKTQQINDILKSLVLEDLDKGRVTTITYPSQDPIAKTLRSFQVDITSNPSLGELLNQLRGAKVKLVVLGQEVEGTILGLEKKKKPVSDKSTIEVWVLNLINGAELRAIEMDSVQRVELLDPQLRDELAKALQALAQARDQDKKPVQIHFAGQGKRRVRIGYVVETPVWKTSYRLIISSAEPDRAGPHRGDPPKEPDRAGPDRGDTARPSPPANKSVSKLQGWAIVENQTDNDWSEVELSLVSGRPISFIQDLYQPLYIPRPVVQPELYASLRPQTYDAGMEANKKAVADFGAPGNGPAAAAGMPPPAPMMRRSAARGLQQQEQAAQKAAEELPPMDAAASVASVASAAKVGELFQYTVGSVTLPRQRSAMISIVTDDIETERLSIYNAGVLQRNPLNGARLKNTSGKHLLAGPVTVLEGGTYAGDASIDNLPPTQERLISFGIDLQMLVDSTKNHQDDVVQTGKIVKGVLIVTRKHVFSQDYVAENKSDHDKTLIIEHPLRAGWTLVDTDKPIETTDTLYRFKGTVAAGKASKLTVKEQVVDSEEVALLPTDPGTLEAYRQTGQIPQAVRDVLAKAISLKGAVADTQRQIQERQQRIAQITAEQARIRENMKTVAQNSDYYNRLLKKLDEQETSIEKLQAEIQGLQKTLEKQQKELEDYIRSAVAES
jgi:hypothetical protein